MSTIRFTADVNNQQRSVELDTDHPTLCAWATEWTDGLTQNGQPDQDDLDAIELCVMNEWDLYCRFYADASDADYDAPLDNVQAEVI